MRRLIFLSTGLAIGLFLISISSFAQEVNYPKAEVFGGFSIASVSLPSSFDTTTDTLTTARTSFWGWQGSANYNLTHHLGLVADFGGQYKTVGGLVPLNSYQFLFGPRIAFRGPRMTPFVHAMFGGIREGMGTFSFTDPVLGTINVPGASSTGFGMGIGGGIDINISDKLALRVPQFDWTLMRQNTIDPTTLLPTTSWNTSAIRIGIGLVFKAGEK
jgi:opacity protein-like surface antigen